MTGRRMPGADVRRATPRGEDAQPCGAWRWGPDEMPEFVDPVAAWPAEAGRPMRFPPVPVWLGRTGSELASRASVRLELTCDPRVETHCCSGATPNGSPLAWINVKPSWFNNDPDRGRFVLAHEIAHAVLGNQAHLRQHRWRRARTACGALARTLAWPGALLAFSLPGPATMPLPVLAAAAAAAAAIAAALCHLRTYAIARDTELQADAWAMAALDAPMPASVDSMSRLIERTERDWDREELTALRFLLNWTVLRTHPRPRRRRRRADAAQTARRRVQAAATGESAASAPAAPRHRRRRTAGRLRSRTAARRRGLASPVQRTRMG
ncbi:ImmA/IrrE family metallo-endopeptidase [Amycolatopsis rubida]|uniref:Peptidase family M48 n=1 Tax=Amycolatopsis rubida TaxID=112413 RepID=A0A1I5XF48_9PSEU|nr:M48 family metalloprotease [Amycolatopsis rubida]SFQ30534.1 Peptidase family M48 [Amycolatopsis rubida]